MPASARAVAVQMDPVETIDIKGDSTFVLGLEAQRRGYALFEYPVAGLSWTPEGVSAQRPAEKLDRTCPYLSAIRFLPFSLFR